MKKSSQVPATLIVAIAASLASSGCSAGTYSNECVDGAGRILPNSACQTGGVRGAHFISTGGFGGSGGWGGAFGG